MMFKYFIYIEKSESTNDQCDGYLYCTCSHLSSTSIYTYVPGVCKKKKRAYLRDLITASGGVILQIGFKSSIFRSE